MAHLCATTTSSPCPARIAPASSIASPACCSTRAATSSTPSSTATRRAGASSCACTSSCRPRPRWRGCASASASWPAGSTWTGSCMTPAVVHACWCWSAGRGIVSTICCSAPTAASCRWTSPRWSPTMPTSPRWPGPTACRSSTCRWTRPTATARSRRLSTWSSASASTWWCWRVTCRSFRRGCARRWLDARSTSTTASCPASRAPSPTTRRMRAGSRSSGPLRTTSPRTWTRARSSNRTWPGWTTP